MSMIIISAICQGFPKHLIWTQHKAGWIRAQHTVCHWQIIFIDILFIHYLLLYLSLFALFYHSHLGYSFNPPPSLTAQFPLSQPPTPTPIPFTWLCRARVWESVTMETGAEAVEGSLRETGENRCREGRRLRTEWCWGIHEWSSDVNLTQQRKGNKRILFTGEWWKHTAGGYRFIQSTSLCHNCLSVVTRSFHWGDGESYSYRVMYQMWWDTIAGCVEHPLFRLILHNPHTSEIS